MDRKILFRDMSEKEFEEYKEWSIKDYASDLFKSGRSDKEKAYQDAKKEFEEILPEGLHTHDNFIYSIVNSLNEVIGMIWYNKNDHDGFICDFLIHEKFRRKGYGSISLTEIEKDAIKKGIDCMVLNVFKFNTPALALYHKIGYEVAKEEDSSLLMKKCIG